MQTAASSVCSKVTPFSFTFSPNSYSVSVGPYNKRLQCKGLLLQKSLVPRNLRPLSTSSNCYSSLLSGYDNAFLSNSVSASNSRIIRPLQPLKYSCSSSTAPGSSDALSTLLKSLKDFSFEPLESRLSELTPVKIVKLCLVLSIAIAATKWTVNLVFNPFFWMYFSWTWLFWPWMTAIGLAIAGFYSFNKYVKGEANVYEQLAIVTSSFTWLTLVPPAHFNGFLEGWPLVFFVVYHYFYFLNVSIRKRMYGDCYPRKHDSKWDVSTPNWYKLLFCFGVMVAHWLAAFEGPELHLIPGGWNNAVIWALIMLTLFMQYSSSLYLANYSQNVVEPKAVVQFGPYRLVRHPIYASIILLFVSYFTALRAPISTVFVIAVCLIYYGQKVKIEEALMLENFEDKYSEYMSKVIILCHFHLQKTKCTTKKPLWKLCI